jgi:hypothetical protein
MIYNAVEGTTFNAVQEFLDDTNAPLQPKPGYPKVRLYDIDKDIIFETVANFVSLGNYTLNVGLPLLNYGEKKQLKLAWVFRDQDNNKYTVSDVVIVEPANLKRDSDLFTISGLDTTASFVLPTVVNQTNLAISLFSGNTLVQVLSPSLMTSNNVDRTTCVVNLPVLQAKFENYLIVAQVNLGTVPKNYTYKLWHTTPSVVSMISLVEDFVNKSRIENTIQELEYTHGDIMSAMLEGLAHFNGIGPQLTSFNGLNMQGAIGNAWFICTCWYLLHAQRLAEGSTAFDFSGQGVSLNVDRTPHLDTLIGAMESRIQDTVIPLKKLLAKAGIVSGDGSQGSNLNGIANSRAAASRMGNLTVTNSPLTRFTRGIRWQTG